MEAKLKDNWLEEYAAFMGPNSAIGELKFDALAKRFEAQGNLIEVVFTAGDIFEKHDNNFWLPKCCFVNVPTPQKETDAWKSL